MEFVFQAGRQHQHINALVLELLEFLTAGFAPNRTLWRFQIVDAAHLPDEIPADIPLLAISVEMTCLSKSSFSSGASSFCLPDGFGDTAAFDK